MAHVPADSGAPCALEDVLITERLAQRPRRAPDHEAEARVLGQLAGELAADPRGLLQRVVQGAMQFCQAVAAGVSVLERDGDDEIIRWHATAGMLAADVHRTMPRHASPCAAAMDRDALL